MHLRLLLLFFKCNSEHLLPNIDMFNLSNQTKLVKVETNNI